MDQKFITHIRNLHGEEKGQKWLDNIPKLIQKYEKEWGIKVEETFPELSFNFVAKAKTNDGKEVVLKIGFPGDKQFLSEAQTLKIYNGQGSIKLLKENLDDFVLLLERCIPGKALYSLNDEEKETLIFTQVCKKIWKAPPANSNFPKVEEDLKDFEWYSNNLNEIKNPLPKNLVEKAYEKFKYLIKTQGEKYLLHSDLHHDNILSSNRGWLAIDCKGVIGEREYETTAFIRNPIKKAQNNLLTKDILLKRIEIICRQLGFDEKRIIDWAFAQTVLAVIWSLQSNSGRTDYWLKIAQELERLC